MKKSKEYLSWQIWTVYLVLFGISVPWYWKPSANVMFLGFPLWVVVSVGGSALISCFTAWLMWTRWPDIDSDDS